MDPIRQWKFARVQLADAAQAFLDTCLALDAVASGLSDDTRAREKLILEVHADSHLVKAVENTVARSHAILNRLSNMSAALVPIHILPAEILGRVFFFASSYSFCYMRRSYEPSHTLASIPAVCTHWRQIALGMRSLWSHIDLNLSSYSSHFDFPPSLGRAKLWAKRADSAPIHLHIARNSYTPPKFISGVFSWLAPYLSTLSSLDLSAEFDAEFAGVLLTHCGPRCPPGSLRKLVAPRLRFYGGGDAPDLNWASLRGLVHLQLDGIIGSMSLNSDGFLDMLCHNPSLSTLRLRGAFGNSIRNHRYSSPTISLPNLRLIDLVDADNSGLLIILPLLVLSSPSLEIRLNISDDLNVVETTCSFLQRTGALSLYLRILDADRSRNLSTYLRSLSHLRSLFLEVSNSWDTRLDIIRSVLNRGLAQCLQLQAIGVVEFDMGVEDLESIVNIAGARPWIELLLINCSIIGRWIPDSELTQVAAPVLVRRLRTGYDFHETGAYESLWRSHTPGRID